MIKTIILVGFLSFSVALNVHADDSARIDRLEKEVQELELRLSRLESLLSDRGESQRVVAKGKGWKSIANWRRLTTAMDYDDVERILGKPERVDGGNLAFWHYPNRGKVTFMRGKVESWSEPRQLSIQGH
ncbi:hypothetical protein [Marinobacter sp. HN1S83]|uniref:hypothetical protein n=1 Tax=Marinobacter sp. HN1S83 TaxID=3382301 RepID=UPI00387B66F0